LMLMQRGRGGGHSVLFDWPRMWRKKMSPSLQLPPNFKLPPNLLLPPRRPRRSLAQSLAIRRSLALLRRLPLKKNSNERLLQRFVPHLTSDLFDVSEVRMRKPN